jgi:hypothetical protein
MTNNLHKPTVATTYTEPTEEPNGCSIAVPSGQEIYITGNKGAVDVDDVKFYGKTWNDMERNAPESINVPDKEVGTILLSDGIHRVFMTWSHYLYVDGNIY